MDVGAIIATIGQEKHGCIGPGFPVTGWYAFFKFHMLKVATTVEAD